MRFTSGQHIEMAERLHEPREEEYRAGEGEEAGGNGEHVPATGETGGEA